MDSLKNSSNAQYHADRTHLSSSQLKMLLKDPQEFYNTYVVGAGPVQEEKAAFTEGSFTHSLILEPHKVTIDYAVFDGMRRAGAKYEEFKAANVGKTIVTIPQVSRCEKLYQAYKAHPFATKMLSDGQPEESFTASIQSVPCKARADYIVPGKYIVDVKTTSMPTDIELFKQTVSEYGYDLSAALYKQIMDKSLGQEHDFYWLVLSKTDFQCALYKASGKTLSRGNEQVAKALELYKSCSLSGIWSLKAPKLTLVQQDEILEV